MMREKIDETSGWQRNKGGCTNNFRMLKEWMNEVEGYSLLSQVKQKMEKENNADETKL